MTTAAPKKSIEILQRAIALQEKKGRDYQNKASTVQQADYYPSGAKTIYEIMHAKMLRMKSLLEAAEAGADAPNFESITDSVIDLINYASFFGAWMENGIEGQNGRNMFGKMPPMHMYDVNPCVETNLTPNQWIMSRNKLNT